MESPLIITDRKKRKYTPKCGYNEVSAVSPEEFCDEEEFALAFSSKYLMRLPAEKFAVCVNGILRWYPRRYLVI